MICRDLDVDRALAARHRQRSLIEGRGPRVNDFIINNYAFGGGDPFAGQVRLLLHFDNTLADSSTYGHVFTARGNAVVSTTSPIMGTGSLLLDGAGDYIDCPNSSAFIHGTDDWTYEWIYRPAGTTNAYDVFAGKMESGNNLYKFDAGLSGNRPRFTATNAGVTVAEYFTSSAVTFTSGNTYPMAWVRSGANFYLFINGISQILTASIALGTGTMPNPSSTFVVGNDILNAGRDVNGRIDEVRITGGARYTANYTPATAPFPNP